MEHTQKQKNIIAEVGLVKGMSLQLFFADKKNSPFSNSSLSIGAFFMNQMNMSQSAASVKSGIPFDEVVSLTSGFEINKNNYERFCREFAITEQDINEEIESAYTRHLKEVDEYIELFHRHGLFDYRKEDLLLDKESFHLKTHPIQTLQTIEQFQESMHDIIQEMWNESDDEYSQHYSLENYAEKEYRIWTLLRKFASLDYEQIEKLSEGKITKYMLATLESPYPTPYDVKDIDREWYFELLKKNMPHHLETFKQLELQVSTYKVMFINLPIFLKDKEHLLHVMEQRYAKKVTLDGIDMYVIKMNFIKKT